MINVSPVSVKSNKLIMFRLWTIKTSMTDQSCKSGKTGYTGKTVSENNKELILFNGKVLDQRCPNFLSIGQILETKSLGGHILHLKIKI
jgi:hypothetical protein